MTEQERSEAWLLEEKYDGEKSYAFFADCARLASGEPLAYIIGHVPFLGCKIWLDGNPLIPRVETEWWVEKAVQEIKNTKQGSASSLCILDLCAGSGAIGVAIAKTLPHSEVDFVEIAPSLLTTIQKNCQENLLSANRYRIFNSDLFANLPADTTYDFILSNPPYLDQSLQRVEPSVKAYEPPLALYGGAAGLEIIERIIVTAPRYLKKGGQLWLEHEPEQTEEIISLAEKNRFSATPHQDQYSTIRYSVLVLQ